MVTSWMHAVDEADDQHFQIHGTNDDVTYYDGDPTNQDGWGACRHS